MSNEPIDLGELEVPEAERVDQRWTFRGLCHLKDPSVDGDALLFGLILDLGFGIYLQINATLAGVRIAKDRGKLAVEFAANWAANGEPNPLGVTTLGRTPVLCDAHGAAFWSVQLERIELEFLTLKARGSSSLAAALVEQGLAVA